MVLKVGADSGKINERAQAVGGNVVGWSDAGQHQDFGRGDGAGGEEHFALASRLDDTSALSQGDANRPAVLDDDPLDKTICLDLDQPGRQRRPKKSIHCGTAPAVPRVDLIESGSALALAIKIMIERKADALCGANKSARQFAPIGMI